MGQRLKALIFDMDGTLANTEEIHRLAFNHAFRDYHLDIEWSEEEYKDLLSISGGKRRIYAYLKEMDVDIPDDLRAYAKKIHLRKSSIYREMLSDGKLELRTGVQRLIESAADEGLRLGIATSSSRANVEKLLYTTLGADSISMFDSISCSDMIADQKPMPALYLFALAEIGVAPEACMAFEDSYNGNCSALRAGIKTLITVHNFTVKNDFSGASLVVDSLGEVDEPFQVLQGNSYGHEYVDIRLIRALVSEHSSQTENESWKPGFVM